MQADAPDAKIQAEGMEVDGPGPSRGDYDVPGSCGESVMEEGRKDKITRGLLCEYNIMFHSLACVSDDRLDKTKSTAINQ